MRHLIEYGRLDCSVHYIVRYCGLECLSKDPPFDPSKNPAIFIKYSYIKKGKPRPPFRSFALYNDTLFVAIPIIFQSAPHEIIHDDYGGIVILRSSVEGSADGELIEKLLRRHGWIGE